VLRILWGSAEAGRKEFENVSKIETLAAKRNQGPLYAIRQGLPGIDETFS
jgi:hypothetical protein